MTKPKTKTKNPAAGPSHGPSFKKDQHEPFQLDEAGIEENAGGTVKPVLPASDATLLDRISWVRQNLPRTIAKDKTVGFGNNTYGVVTHENINNFLRPLMVKAGLVDTLSEIAVESYDTGLKQGQAERPVIHVKGQFVYSVLCNGEKLEVTVTGWGEDTGDKGPGKAQTYALKSGRKILFSISAGDNEEERGDDSQIIVAAQATLNPEELSCLFERCDELFGEDSEKVMKALCDRILNVSEPKLIQRVHFDSAMKALDNKHKRDNDSASEDGSE